MSENLDPSPAPEERPSNTGDATPPPSTISKEERTMAMLCHLLAFSGLVIPFVGHILGPLVIWLVKKDTMPAVDAHGKESINFQITLTIVITACALTSFLILPALIAIAVAIAAMILIIMNAIKANEGQTVRYPFTIRFIK